MSPMRRINVSSGRPLEPLAHYSRAIRVGDRVLQSGTTAIDTEGNIIGDGDVAKQVDAIIGIAEETMGRAGGSLEDVVRARLYVTDIALADQAADAFARHFGDIRPASTLVAVNGLARPTQLIEIELDAVDGAKDNAVRISSGRPTEERWGYSRAVRMGDTIYVSGSTALTADGAVAHPGDMYGQTRATLETIFDAVEQASGAVEDIVYTKTFMTDIARVPDRRRAALEAFGDTRPTSTVLGIPDGALVRPEMLVEIEAEAIVGAAAAREHFYSGDAREKPLGYARAVAVGDVIHVSGCTAMDSSGQVQGVGDWAAQYDLCLRHVQAALEQAGAVLDDVVRRRTFTVAGATRNRAYGEGPSWFADSRPSSLGCTIDRLVHTDMAVEVDAWAVRGAHANIEWLATDSQ
ncbi:MAG: Rid family hydrolase [Alphaproteobacteria bacterium]|nr:Rid family hydrolase [Alphaproteobacteria bacterium]